LNISYWIRISSHRRHTLNHKHKNCCPNWNHVPFVTSRSESRICTTSRFNKSTEAWRLFTGICLKGWVLHLARRNATTVCIRLAKQNTSKRWSTPTKLKSWPALSARSLPMRKRQPHFFRLNTDSWLRLWRLIAWLPNHEVSWFTVPIKTVIRLSI
jgi:hypothetical protein